MISPGQANTAKIPPSPNRSDPPDFYKFDSDTFEEMTNALYEKEPGISRADLYRTKFKSQYGIDVYAERSDESGIEVASCKCYQYAAKGKIPEWGYDFLKHLDTHWKGKNVKKFVLVTAAYVNSAEREAEVQKERARFKKHGIQYEVWAPRNLQSKLRGHRGIVSQYLGTYWANVLCGESTFEGQTQIDRIPITTYQINRQIVDLQESLSSRVVSILNFEVENIRKGKLSSVEKTLLELRRDNEWVQLTPTAQVKVIRLQASICLQKGELAEASNLSEESDKITFEGGARLRALILCRKGCLSAGLSCLDNASEVADLQLKIALLIEARRLDEANELLAEPRLNDENDAETHRLKAFVALLNGKREESYFWIQKAEKLAGDWIAIRRGGAMIRYALALSPAVPDAMYLSPNPVDRDLLREDVRSQNLLKEALERYRSLLESDPDQSMRDIDTGWVLACLCNIQDEKDAARQYCSTLLATSPENSPAVAWALMRGFDFDKTRSLTAIQELLARGDGDTSHVLTAGWLLLDADGIAEAKDILEKYQDKFKSDEEARLRRERVERLSHLLANRDSDEFKAGTAKHLAVFENAMAEVPLSPTGLLLAQQMAAAGRWDVLYKHIDRIIGYQTTAAVRVAVYAAFNTRKPGKALEIMESQRHLFAHSILPRELRQLEVHAIAAAHGSAAAIKYAYDLAAESGDFQDNILAANLSINVGDIAGAIPVIREANRTNKLLPIAKLQLSTIVAREDTTLGQELWLTAVREGLPDSLIPLALSKAYPLGLDSETPRLHSQAAILFNQPNSGMQVRSIEDLTKLVSQLNEDTERANSMYTSAAIPTHALFAINRFDFARTYRLQSPTLQPIPALSVPFIAHGGRGIRNGLEKPFDAVSLHIDITSLLLAEQLNLLDTIEKSKNPIVISASTSLALIELEQKLCPTQPMLLRAFQKIHDAVTDTSIKVWQAPSGTPRGKDSHAAASYFGSIAGMLVLYHLPEGDGDSDVTRFTSLPKVLDGLKTRGLITEAAISAAKTKSGIINQEEFGLEPGPGIPLIFMGNTLSLIASVELFQDVAQEYDVYIEASFANEIKAALKRAEADSAYLEVVAGLRRRIANGIKNGCYTCTRPQITQSYDGTYAADETYHHDRLNSAVANSLFELIGAPVGENTVLWVDDRYITSMPRIGPAQTVGITEILDGLWKSGQVSETAYFEALLSLRASMVMYIPISKDEVLYHLNAAAVVNGKVVENANLATLRRYFARYVQLEKYLTVGSNEAGRPSRLGEADMLLQMRQLHTKCVAEVWNHCYPDFILCEARANWIWGALRQEQPMLPQVAPPGDPAPQNSLVGMELAVLLATVFQLKIVRAADHPPMDEAYMNWAAGKIVVSRVRGEKALAKHMSAYLKIILPHIFKLEPDKTIDDDIKPQWENFVRMVVSKFPDEINSILWEDSEIRELIKVVNTEEIEVAGYRFDGREMLGAVALAIQNGSARVKVLNGEKLISIECEASNKYGVMLVDDANKVRMEDPAYAMLVESDEMCRVILEANINWFDVCEEEREERIDHILGLDDKVRRLYAVDEARKHSANLYYWRLDLHRHGEKPIALHEFLPPGAYALLGNLRLQSDLMADFPLCLDKAADALITDYGVEGAFSRLVGLPTAMPQRVIDEFLALEKVVLLKTLGHLFQAAVSPLRLFHMFSLIRHLNLVNVPDAQKYVDECLQKWDDASRSFSIIIRWVADAYCADPAWETLSVSQQLVVIWVHADRITQFLISLGVSSEAIQSSFAKKVSADYADSAFHQSPLKEDIACPDYLFEDALLFHGLAYSLGDSAASTMFTREQISSISGRLIKAAEPDSEKFVTPLLRTISETGVNNLGSFLALRPDGLLNGGFDASLKTAIEFQTELANSLNTELPLSGGWVTLWAIARPTLDSEVGKIVALLIQELSFQTLFAVFNEGDIGMQAIVQLASKFGGKDLRNSLRNKILEIVEREASRFASNKTPFDLYDEGERATFLKRIVNFLVMLSESRDLENALRFFGNSLEMVAEIWPSATIELRGLVERIYEQSRVNHSRPLWETRMALQTKC